MAPGYLTNREEIGFCSECGRQLQRGASSSGRYYYCHHGEEFVSSSMSSYSGQYYNNDTKPLSESQKSRLFLIDKRNQEIKRSWKRDQYARVKGQIRF